MRQMLPRVVPSNALRHPVQKVQRVLRDVRVRSDILYPNLATLVARHGATGVGLTPYELKVFSQNGEDGVIAEVLRRVGAMSQSFVEFGIGSGVEGNCVFLADVLGWHGTFIEASSDLHARLARKYVGNDSVRTLCQRITAENVDEILGGTTATTVDVLSIDIDGNDYWVWKALEAVEARLVVIEYNGSLDPRQSLVQPYRPDLGWDASGFFGASLGALVELGRHKGYTLVHTELTGTNAFFVKDELAPELGDLGPPPRRGPNYSLQGMSHGASSSTAGYLTVGDGTA